jgi:sugar phosphate isomerase/epimerase
MPIKIGFSTSVCPEWDLHTIAEQANALGFYGVELGTVRDKLHLPDAEDLQSDQGIDGLRQLFDEQSVAIACIASQYALDPKDKHIAAGMVRRNIENIELAGKLGCPLVRIPLGKRVGRESQQQALARQIPRIAELGDHALRHNVTLVISNTPDFPSSRAVWFVVDGVSHPAIRAAWDPVLSLSSDEHETPTLAVKRLSARLRQVQAVDAEFDERGQFLGFRRIGHGSVDYPLAIDLLKGVLFDGYLMLDWPKAAVEDLPEPGQALPETLAFLLERIQHIDPVLTAYKKDDHPPSFQHAPKAFEARVVKSTPQQKAEATETDGGDADGSGSGGPGVAKGADPKIAALVAEAVKKARGAKGG